MLNLLAFSYIKVSTKPKTLRLFTRNFPYTNTLYTISKHNVIVLKIIGWIFIIVSVIFALYSLWFIIEGAIDDYRYAKRMDKFSELTRKGKKTYIGDL